ncbi:unnamed protein product [Phyllotreta striolata]|uniref:endo-polygalacturonase n=1 Tax=Phyllotreta striolata TaxID=444603 RepID=A0A9N9T9D5_PHYSR|nr:unnamed protein product [Phyllotreta striolata]
MLTPLRLTAVLLALVAQGSSESTKCTVTEFSQVENVVKNCKDIVVSNLVVPGGETLELYLNSGTTLTFEGITVFDHKEWSGPLIRVRGNNITIQGAPGSLLNGQGELYWDHMGDKGPKKPQFMKIEAFDGSVFKDIKIINCPHHCIYIGKSDQLTITGWIIDNSYGDHDNFTGHNTDGFDVSAATNLVIEKSTVINQDDCIALRHGANILVRNMFCSGGHGISLSTGFNYTLFEENTLYNVTVEDSVIVRSDNGIHVKTHADSFKGEIKNVTYSNIFLSGIHNYGINVQQDYVNGSATGIPNNNIPIIDLNLINIHGNVLDVYNNSMPVYINCGKEACVNWTWSGVNVSGGREKSKCNNYEPNGYKCLDNTNKSSQSLYVNKLMVKPPTA